jgi:hypothetical protein
VDSGTLDRLTVDKVTLGEVHCGQRDTATGLLWTR